MSSQSIIVESSTKTPKKKKTIFQVHGSNHRTRLLKANRDSRDNLRIEPLKRLVTYKAPWNVIDKMILFDLHDWTTLGSQR
ncbi:unnamed protein product, partial [Nesidiocoris tenuis]